jgi:hypothetical protein
VLRALALGSLVLCGCLDDGHGGAGGLSRVDAFEIAGYAPPAIDLLLVIDDSTHMAPYQERLRAVFPALAVLVEASATGMDLRVAAITAGGDGTLRRSPRVRDPFVVAGLAFDGSPQHNYTGGLAEAIGALADVGATSNAPSRPLAATAGALAENAGDFVRDDAFLFVVTASASDDASPGETRSYTDAWTAHKGAPGRVGVSGIYAQPAPRLDDALVAFAQRSAFTPLDASSYAHALERLGELNEVARGSGCIVEPADVDRELPGMQYDCAVQVVTPDGERVLPPCSAGLPGACWTMHPDPVCASDRQVLVDVRGFTRPYRPHLRGECVVN